MSVVGFGHVGKALAYLLGSVAEPLLLNIMDPNLNEGSFADIRHSLGASAHQLAQNDQRLLASSEVVFHCAGASVPKGASRLEVAAQSMEITEAVFGELKFLAADPLVVVLANPLDVLVTQLVRLTGLPAERVVGTGTLLDTYRFNALVADELGCAPCEVDGWVLGEHGDTMVLWASGSRTTDGRPLTDQLSLSKLEELLAKTRTTAAMIKSHQGATYYGVARCALVLWEAFLNDEQRLLPASVIAPDHLRQRYRLPEVALSLPLEIGRKQLRVGQLDLTDTEAAGLSQSAETIRQAYRQAWSRAQ